MVAPTSVSSSSAAVALSLVVALVALNGASGFVIFDRTNSCIREFGCLSAYVGMLVPIDSAESCQAMCDASPACNYFTWRSGETSMFDKFCFLHSTCDDLDFECLDCYSGPQRSACPLQASRNL